MKTTIQHALDQSSSLQNNCVTSSTHSQPPRKRPAAQRVQAGKNKQANQSTPQLMAVAAILQQAESVDDLSYRPYDKLWKAVKKDDVSSLQNLLTPETSLNARYGEKGWTLLQYAVQLGHVDSVNFLIQQGANIHTKTPGEEWSALHLACSHYDDKRSKERILILQSLIKAGADLEQVTKGGWTPLHWAAQQGSYNSVECLIHEGAKVNVSTSYEEAPGERGLTPLLLAIKNHHDNVVELLLDHGADPNQKSADHIAPLPLAVAECPTAIVKPLARKKANVKKISKSHIALLQGYLKRGRLLIKAGADVNQRSGDEGRIPLQLTDNIDMIKILLENSKTQINATSRDQWSASHWHVYKGNLPIVELLLEKKPDLSLKTEAGDTPVDLAKKIGNATMIDKLQKASFHRINNPLPIKKRFSSLTVEGLNTPDDSHEPRRSAESSQDTRAAPGNSTQDPLCHYTPEEIQIARVIAQLNTAVPSHSMSSTLSPRSHPPSSTPTPRAGSVIVHTDQFL